MLDQYLETAARRLNEGIKVYLCPASQETVIAAKMLKKRFSVLPSGFCDNDARKQDRYLNSLPELKIVSFDKALEHETAEFLVISPHHSAEIIGNLVFERGISQERILNYHPIERRKTCALFAQNWIIEDADFVCCCVEPRPKIIHDSPEPQKRVELLTQTRNGLIDGTIPLPTACVNCFHNRESYIYTSRKLNSFDFSFRGWCNYKCEYCSAHHPNRKNYNDRFALEQYLEELEKRDSLNDIVSVLYAVGESTLNEKRFGLYDYCREKGYFLDVFTNCSVFDKALFELAQEDPVIIRTSFDAGTPETYAKIKGVDCWQKMLENVKHYLQAPFLVLNPKYLFVPGINDNEVDVTNFVKVCVDLSVDFVTPVFSFLDDRYVNSNHAREMFKLLVDELASNNIFTANVDTLYSEDYHKAYEESF